MRRFTPRLFSAAAAVAVVSLAGCSHSTARTGSAVSGSAGSPVQVAFVTNNPSSYWTIARAGVDAEAKKHPDLAVQFIMPADGSAATQKSDVDDVIARGAKAIAISPVDPANQTPWLNQVASQAALITQDSDAPQSKRICYIGTDNVKAGMMVGALIKKALGPAGGKIMMFVGDRSAQNAKDREQGIREALQGSNVDILDVRTDQADHARAKSNAADALVKYPDLAMEVGLWSYNGPAILSAVKDAGKVGKVKIVCFDQDPATIAGVESGAIYGTVVQNPYQIGVDAVKMMDQLIKGDKSGVPASGTIYIPAEIVTQANAKQYQAILDKQIGKA